MNELKEAWEGGDGDRAVRLFSRTSRYYERPFSPGTTLEDISSYWKDIAGQDNIELDYTIVAVEGSVACVHWQNRFDSPEESKSYHLDGIFQLEFDDEGFCREFRQWWFMEG